LLLFAVAVAVYYSEALSVIFLIFFISTESFCINGLLPPKRLLNDWKKYISKSNFCQSKFPIKPCKIRQNDLA